MSHEMFNAGTILREAVWRRRSSCGRRLAAVVLTVAAVGTIVSACDAPSDRNDLMGEAYATETDIRATAVRLFEAMSHNDWGEYNRLQCGRQRSSAPVDPEFARKVLGLEVVGVEVMAQSDISAQVVVEFRHSDDRTGTHTEEITIIREDHEWRAC